MSFETLIPWLLPVFLILGPVIFKWYQKRELNSTTNLPNEAPVRWRQLDISKNKQPFSGWAGSSNKAFLRISSDGIYCADISIPFSKIKKATAYSPTDHPFGKNSYAILRIETKDILYDFNISYYRLAKMELPFEVN